jgi:DNA-binding transcriptional ArsR family regulator
LARQALVTANAALPDNVPAEAFAHAAGTFALLAHPKRVQLLWLLVQHEHDVTALAVKVSLTISTVSHHLTKLRMAQLVTVRADGRRQIYSAVPDPYLRGLITEALSHRRRR